MDIDNKNNLPNATVKQAPTRFYHQFLWYRRNQARVMLGIALCFCLLQFFLQLSSGVMVGAWMHDFHISAYLAGMLAAAYYLVYTCLQTPVGMMMDRFGPRILLFLGSGFCGLFCLMFAATHWFSVALLARVGIGTWAAFAFVGCLAVIRSWFPPARYAMMVGLVETIGLSATIFGNLIVASVIDSFGWRLVLVLVGLGLISIAGLVWYCFKDAPDVSDIADLTEKPLPVFDQHKQRPAFLPILKEIVSNRQNWLNGAVYGLLFSAVTVFAGLWAVPFFVLSHHMALPVATAAASMILVGAAMGGPFFGAIVRDEETRRQVLIAGAFISAMLLALVIYVPQLSNVMTFVLLFSLGVACSVYIFTFAFAKDNAPEKGYATMIGFTNAIGVGVAPILQPLLGWILHFVRMHHGAVHQLPTVADYHVALMVLPIAMVVAGLCAVQLKVTPQPTTEDLEKPALSSAEPVESGEAVTESTVIN